MEPPGIKKEEIRNFLIDQNTVQNTFRTLLLFGKNSATYKFAFCHALLQQKPKDSISYAELRDDFVRELLRHHQNSPHQFNKGETKLTTAMNNFLASDQSEPEYERLIEVSEQSIYNNVFDAFQNVGMGTVGDKYKLFEHNKRNKQLILTDNTNFILESPKLIEEISLENQSRWCVVEEAWRSKLSPNLLDYNPETNAFVSINEAQRVGLRSAVDVLLPYQKGKCFYCQRPIDRFTDSQNDCFPDVDHFLPLTFLVRMKLNGVNSNGVWNLVVACKSCNRGEAGKFDAPPDANYFTKLLARNLLYIEEHKHSLRNSIMISLGVSSKVGVETKMQQLYNRFKMIRGWKPKELFTDF